MNIVFWSLMLLMLLVAIGIVIYPLLKARSAKTVAYRDSNLRLYEDKIQELNIDLSDGRIDQEQYRAAREELDRELLHDVPAENRETATVHYSASIKKHPALALGIAGFIPVLALLMYMQLGMHAAVDKEKRSEDHPQLSIEEMVQKLEQHLRSNEGTLEEWTMLARTYKHLGRYADSAQAFAEVVERSPNAQTMLERAEALALANNQQFDAESRSLVMKALELDPDNINVLWFAGVAEFQAGNYRKTIDYLSRLSGLSGNDPDVDRSIRMYIEEARAQLIASGENVSSVDEILQVEKTAGSAGTQVEVRVGISEQARAGFDGSDTVFVYAKAQQGPPMPLAAARLTLADLPATIVLDDNMAMVDGMNLSAFNSVVVSARVSKTGSAIATSGDYIGEINVDDVTATNQVKVIIDSAVP